MKRHSQCLVWACAGALLGVAAVAHGQDPSVVQTAADPDLVQAAIKLLQAGGLPAVLTLLGFGAGRWGGIPVSITVQLHPDDRAELRRIRRAIERDDDSEEPPPPRTA